MVIVRMGVVSLITEPSPFSRAPRDETGHDLGVTKVTFRESLSGGAGAT
jgi:hypothetical protein